MRDVPIVTTAVGRAAQIPTSPLPWFMTTYLQQLGRLAAHQNRRTQYAEEARRRATAADLFSIDSIIAAALNDVRAESATFRDDFNAEPPVPLRYALDTETGAWERLEGGLILFQQAEPAPHELPPYAGSVRTYLTCQLDLLATEQELLYSCLADQYVQRVDAISARLAEVSL